MGTGPGATAHVSCSLFSRHLIDQHIFILLEISFGIWLDLKNDIHMLTMLLPDMGLEHGSNWQSFVIVVSFFVYLFG